MIDDKPFHVINGGRRLLGEPLFFGQQGADLVASNERGKSRTIVRLSPRQRAVMHAHPSAAGNCPGRVRVRYRYRFARREGHRISHRAGDLPKTIFFDTPPKLARLWIVGRKLAGDAASQSLTPKGTAVDLTINSEEDRLHLRSTRFSVALRSAEGGDLSTHATVLSNPFQLDGFVVHS